jgi:DNA processing protein
MPLQKPTEPLTVAEALGRPLNDVEAKNAPPALFGAGRWELLRGAPRVSLVGSRAATADGTLLAVSLASALARQGIIVLSGLAEGIDTAAHRTAIRLGGDTIGVIGTPLSQFYPVKNRELQRHMMAEQLVISQFREGVRTGRADFPRRNRTMALLSDATVIVEAQDKSGSLHQGWEALRLGRPLYIMQRSVNDPSLTWPAELLRYGARPLEADAWEPLIDELPESLPDYATFTF